jgi:Fe2+ or Zn2+ uptake regulation protein
VISRTAGTPTFHKVCTYTEWVAQVEDAAKQAKRESRQTSTQAEVLEALAAANGQLLTCRQVVEAMGLEWGDRGNGKDPSRVREALNRLADEGEIQRVRSGTQYTFAAASHGTQIVSDTSTTSAALPHKGSERRDQPRQTSAPVKCSASADSCRDVPRHRKALQRSAAEVPEASEAQGAACQELAIPGMELVELVRQPAASGADAFVDGDDPHWGPRQEAA